MLRNDKFCISRLGPVPQSKVDNTLLQGVCSAVFCNDISAARTLLHESSSECFFNRRVSTPFGGHRVFPIECIVESAATEEEKAELAEYLHNHGASMNIAWRDTTGEHTPLSKALSLRQFRLAAALVACGASTSTALLETSLLENTKFDPRVARWLLDMGADVTVPAHHSPRTCLGSAGSISAVVTVLGKAGVELQVMRHLASLHALPSSTQRQQEQRLLRRVAYVLALLTAAGAPPARPPPAAAALAVAQAGTAADGMQPPGFALQPQLEPQPQQGAHAAVPPAAVALVSHLTLGERDEEEDGELDSAFGSPSSLRPVGPQDPAPLPSLERLRLGPGPSSPARTGLAAVPSRALFNLSPQDWEFLQPYATQALEWSPELNFLFPAPLRKAIREVVLISCCRGFGVGSSSALAAAWPSQSSSAAVATPATDAGQVEQEQEQGQRQEQEQEQEHRSSRQSGPGSSLGDEPRSSSQQQQQPGFGEPRPQPSAQRRAGSSPRAPASQAAAAALWWQQNQPQAGVVWLDGNVVESIILTLAKVWFQRP